MPRTNVTSLGKLSPLAFFSAPNIYSLCFYSLLAHQFAAEMTVSIYNSYFEPAAQAGSTAGIASKTLGKGHLCPR